MSKNDVAWGHFIKEKNVLAQMYHPGYMYISADELKEIAHREPRLLAKQDTLAQRPREFRAHNIAIFPVKNGEYILFRDDKNRSFYKFEEKDYSLPIEVYQSKIDLHSFDTFPGAQNLSESQAIDFAYLSSLLRKFTGERDLNLVIRGRLFSGEFDFRVPEIKHNVNVSSVQIEVDAGYESPTGIYLIEAKTSKRDDFHIRQLYYPYLEWSHKSKKQIHPIFLIYSNAKYYIYEFEFSDAFGELRMTRSTCFAVNESPTGDLNLPRIIRSTRPQGNPDVPFPQADDMDKVVDLVSLLSGSELTKNEIAEHFEFDERQGDYYANAARYLGLVTRTDAGYSLTKSGSDFLKTSSSRERTNFIVTKLVELPIFRDSIQLLATSNYELPKVDNTLIANIISENTGLTGATPIRRALTVRSWLAWVLANSRIT